MFHHIALFGLGLHYAKQLGLDNETEEETPSEEPEDNSITSGTSFSSKLIKLFRNRG